MTTSNAKPSAVLVTEPTPIPEFHHRSSAVASKKMSIDHETVRSVSVSCHLEPDRASDSISNPVSFGFELPGAVVVLHPLVPPRA